LSAAPGTLPVFLLDAQHAHAISLIAKLHMLTGLPNDIVEVNGDWDIYRSGARRFDVNRRTFEIWYSDESKLWKPTFAGYTPHRTTESASGLTLQSLQPLAKDGHFFKFGSGDVQTRLIVGPWTESVAECTEMKYRSDTDVIIERMTLDWHLPIATEIRVPPLAGASPEGWVPLVGKRVRCGVTCAVSGEVIGFHGALTSASQPPTWWKAIPQEKSVQAFRERFSHVRLIQHPPPSLAYEVWESDERSYLYPVWVHRASMWVGPGSRTIDLPIMFMPASEFEIAQPYDIVERSPIAPTVQTRAEGLPANVSSHDAKNAPRFTTGAWWAQLEKDVIHADRNAAEFAGTLPKSQWDVLKVDGNQNQLREDWLSKSAQGIELTDLAYYAGHAGPFGWHFNKKLSPTFAVSPSDIGKLDTNERFFGRLGRLKWIALCACGPLQEKLGPGMPDVMKRWCRAFDGLHTLMGYATVIDARPRTGSLFARHLQTRTVIDAWLTTARQLQFGPSVRVAVMYGFTQGIPNSDPLLDSVGNQVRIASTSKEPDKFLTIYTSA
jgi:hypothetical protein